MDHKYDKALLSGPYPSPIPYIPRRGYAEQSGRQIHFRDTGTGSPLLLLHQAPSTSRQFTNVYKLLSDAGIRAIGVDMPGFGESDPFPCVPCIEDFAPAILSVLDHLGIEQADVLGHHTGAILATEISLQFPKRIRKLILNGPFITENDDDLNKWLDIARREIAFEYSEDGSHLTRPFSWPSSRLTHPSILTRRAVEKFQGYAPFWTGHHAAFIYDHASAIARVCHPTLILTNTGDMIHEHAERVAALRTDFAYVSHDGGTVYPMDEMPEQWTQAVCSFLAS